jgi:hypothetical protein
VFIKSLKRYLDAIHNTEYSDERYDQTIVKNIHGTLPVATFKDYYHDFVREYGKIDYDLDAVLDWCKKYKEDAYANDALGACKTVIAEATAKKASMTLHAPALESGLLFDEPLPPLPSADEGGGEEADPAAVANPSSSTSSSRPKYFKDLDRPRVGQAGRSPIKRRASIDWPKSGLHPGERGERRRADLEKA